MLPLTSRLERRSLRLISVMAAAGALLAPPDTTSTGARHLGSLAGARSQLFAGELQATSDSGLTVQDICALIVRDGWPAQ